MSFREKEYRPRQSRQRQEQITQLSVSLVKALNPRIKPELLYVPTKRLLEKPIPANDTDRIKAARSFENETQIQGLENATQIAMFYENTFCPVPNRIESLNPNNAPQRKANEKILFFADFKETAAPYDFRFLDQPDEVYPDIFLHNAHQSQKIGLQGFDNLIIGGDIIGPLEVENRGMTEFMPGARLLGNFAKRREGEIPIVILTWGEIRQDKGTTLVVDDLYLDAAKGFTRHPEAEIVEGGKLKKQQRKGRIMDMRTGKIIQPDNSPTVIHTAKRPKSHLEHESKPRATQIADLAVSLVKKLNPEKKVVSIESWRELITTYLDPQWISNPKFDAIEQSRKQEEILKMTGLVEATQVALAYFKSDFPVPERTEVLSAEKYPHLLEIKRKPNDNILYFVQLNENPIPYLAYEDKPTSREITMPDSDVFIQDLNSAKISLHNAHNLILGGTVTGDITLQNNGHTVLVPGACIGKSNNPDDRFILETEGNIAQGTQTEFYPFSIKCTDYYRKNGTILDAPKDGTGMINCRGQFLGKAPDSPSLKLRHISNETREY